MTGLTRVKYRFKLSRVRHNHHKTKNNKNSASVSKLNINYKRGIWIKKTSAKIVSVVLFVHGFVEMLAVTMPFAPVQFLSTGFQEKTFFWVAISAIYGLSRLFAGYTIWLMKK